MFKVGYSQDVSFDINEDYNNIITKLFEGEMINGKECTWKLNLSEKFQFQAMENDSLYTSIVTVFSYKEIEKVN